MIIWSLLIPIALYVLISTFFAHKIRAVKFKDRDDLSFEQIYEDHFQYFDLSKSNVEQVWKETALALRISSKKLRPTDTFDKELKYYVTWLPFGNLNDDFEAYMYFYFKEGNIDFSEGKNIKSLGDYVVMAARVLGKG